ncbi:unnamed protein product [Dibothriocephalus latus]|uniref:Uncharacterized protein n=1 Tax=Dibothriocephalus latus TaxID=60516 RepID=A0A3P7MRJ8_DIBLA|nr:unnamed protein product [Dibothriocephalus latus]
MQFKVINQLHRLQTAWLFKQLLQYLSRHICVLDIYADTMNKFLFSTLLVVAVVFIDRYAVATGVSEDKLGSDGGEGGNDNQGNGGGQGGNGNRENGGGQGSDGNQENGGGQGGNGNQENGGGQGGNGNQGNGDGQGGNGNQENGGGQGGDGNQENVACSLANFIDFNGVDQVHQQVGTEGDGLRG